MATFPTYDAASDTINLNGSAVVLLTLLVKSKFGTRFDPETLFHPDLPILIRELHAATGLSNPAAGDSFDRADLITIAKTVVGENINLGWWSMSDSGKRSLLQGAAAPWVLSEDQVQTIMEDVDDLLFRHREVVAAADAANEAR